MLLMRSGRAVGIDTLIDRLWDGLPPPRARDTLYAYLTRLRNSLRRAGCGDDVAEIRREPAGYVMRVDAEHVDVHVFRNLQKQAALAAEAGDDVLASALHRDAEELWRGEPLADLHGGWAAQ